MVKYIPFPPALAEVSAKNAKMQYSARMGKSKDYVSRDLAVYRDADGRLHRAYNSFEPQYPEGAEPGLGDVSARLKYYPNETSGYELTVTTFTPASELLRDAPLHDPERQADAMDRLAVAHVRLGRNYGQESGFIWALDETQMKAWLDALPEEAVVSRATLTRHDMRPGDVANSVLMTRAVGGTEIHVAACPEDLAKGVKERYSFIGFDGLSDIEVLEKVGEYGRERGWIVGHDIVDTQHPLGLAVSMLLVQSGNSWLVDELGNIPDAAYLRPPVPIHMAEISLDGGRMLEFAYDAEMLEERIAKTLSEITGDLPEDTAPVSTEDFITSQLVKHGFDISRGAGHAHLAYGREPRELAFLKQEGEPNIIFAAGTQDNLERLVKDHLESRLKDIDMAGDDILDVMWRVGDDPDFDMWLGRTDTHDDDMASMRAILTSQDVSEPGL
ncbi:hypothetical protein KUV57_12345 [Epibacterium sp. DP7N7-1]|nr:hypothetical protein [Epibacterium sp. DP7N7-1]